MTDLQGRPAAASSVDARPGFWRRNAWRFLAGLAVIVVLFGVGDIVRGLDADPAIPEGVTGLTIDEIRSSSPTLAALLDLQVRFGGIHLLILGGLWLTLVSIPLRRGERWAWLALWSLPLWGLAVSVSFLFVDRPEGAPIPPPAISGWVFFALGAAALWATPLSRTADGHEGDG